MNRWIRLTWAVVAMMMIANLQYSWTLFVKPIIAANHWKLSDVQWGFTLFVAFQTWVMPACGWLIDRLGPRLFLSIAAILCGVGWSGLGYASTLPELYALYSLAGFGAAFVYSGSMGVGLKWFPDKRGAAAGLIAAGYGSGAALFIPVIAAIIHSQNYRAAFLYTGVAEALLILCAAQFLQNPDGVLAHVPAKNAKVRSHTENFTPGEMLRTPHFYLLFAMALMMGIGGLMLTAQLSPIADTFKVGAAALTISLTVNPLANGGGRIFWGWVSDRIGRENTMVVAFILQSLFLIGVVLLGHTPLAFVITVALVYFTWGEVYSLFPSACTDFFGARNASSNYGFLYSAKGVAAILGGGLAAMLYEHTHSWTNIFYACAALALISAGGAVLLQRLPLPRRDAVLASPAVVSQEHAR